ncbi:hypothetical protein BJX96DRAFT_130140 [Aspergillus floccosus]
MNASTPPKPTRIFLLAQPRMTSNLLTRLLGLGGQPNIYYDEDTSYPFVDLDLVDAIIQLQSNPVDTWTEDEKNHLKQSYQRCFDRLDQYRAKGEADDKVVFAKEHCNLLWRPDAGGDTLSAEFTVSLSSQQESGHDDRLQNPTVLPSAYLGAWKPIFLIRHPARSFISYYRAFVRLYESRPEAELCPRAQDDYIASQMSFSFTRSLYDWYVEYSALVEDTTATPLVLDADDYINRPELVSRLADVLGLDADRVQYTWSPRRDHLLSPISRVWKGTVASSSGVRKDKAAGDVDIQEESKKWEAEFGESRAEMLRNCVVYAMADYEYLKSKRFC